MMRADHPPPGPKAKMPLVLAVVAGVVTALPIAGHLAVEPLYRNKPELRSKLEPLIVERVSGLKGKSPRELAAALGKPGRISFWAVFPKERNDFLGIEIPCDPDPSASPGPEVPPMADIAEEGEFLRQLYQRLNGQPADVVRKRLAGLNPEELEVDEIWFYPNEGGATGIVVRFRNGLVSGIGYAD